MPSALSPDTERALADAARAWPDALVLMLFGSAAAGRLRPTSDIDLYVRLAPGSARDPGAEALLVAEASRICRRDVDLIVEGPSTSVILRREVATHGRALFERTPGAARTLRVEGMHAYMDLEPQLRLIGDAIRARAVAEGRDARERLLKGGERG